MQKDFEVLPHTADLKIKAYGKDLQTLFVNALKGMFYSIKPQRVGEDSYERPFVVESHDLESLLVDFLSEALSLCDVYKEAYLDADISTFQAGGMIPPTGDDLFKIEGVLKGIKIDDFQEGEIKAVTHHDLKIKKVGDQWEVEVLFDL